MSKIKKNSFHQELVLNHWMMGFFKGGALHALKNRLGEDRHEGIDEDEVVFTKYGKPGKSFHPGQSLTLSLR